MPKKPFPGFQARQKVGGDREEDEGCLRFMGNGAGGTFSRMVSEAIHKRQRRRTWTNTLPRGRTEGGLVGCKSLLLPEWAEPAKWPQKEPPYSETRWRWRGLQDNLIQTLLCEDQGTKAQKGTVTVIGHTGGQ